MKITGMKWKELIADYFNFSRKDRIAIITLLLIMAGVFFLPKMVSTINHPKTVLADTEWIAAMKKLEVNETRNEQRVKGYDDDHYTSYQYDRPVNQYNSKSKGELFYFDPNTLSEEGWQKLGLREKTIHTIAHFLGKGGRFKKPEDLQRIYGLFPDEYERIAPFIKMDPMDDPDTEKIAADNPNTVNPPVKKYASGYSGIDINSADTTTFISLPGIGSKLAARIVNFREKLGGFYSVTQVGETFGLPDSTFQKIKQYLKIDNTNIRKININTATADDLKAHPYIRWGLANPIVAYRNEHGLFAKPEDIKKVMAVTEEIFNKIAPYLITQ